MKFLSIYHKSQINIRLILSLYLRKILKFNNKKMIKKTVLQIFLMMQSCMTYDLSNRFNTFSLLPDTIMFPNNFSKYIQKFQI